MFGVGNMKLNFSLPGRLAENGRYTRYSANKNFIRKTMSPALLLSVIAIYFLLVGAITYLTSSDDSNRAFFRAKRNSPWHVVAFGMIGASLSGVTFVSVPGLGGGLGGAGRG